MPGGKDLFSPHSAAAHGGRLHSNPTTPQQFISPSTRHRVGLTSPTVFISPSIANDDVAERKERRRSRVLELQRRHLSSPATPPDRRQSASLAGLTNTQLTEHYASCIKLSAENKINAKNAFGLHLIDYMSDLLKKKEMTSFQVASSTLDASAKIYAGRVDAIHSETYKVLSGLGRGNDRSKETDTGGGDDDNFGDEQENTGVEKKRKRARKSNTIETNLKNINVNKFDLEFEVDPLFQKTSATFDEGGTGGLLLNHLQCRDDSSEIILDSNTVIMHIDHHDETASSQTPRVNKIVKIKELKDLCNGVNLESQLICPAFSDFEFTNWNKDDEDETIVSEMKGIDDPPTSEHAFDLDAQPECEAGSHEEAMSGVIDDAFDHMGDDNDNDDAASQCGEVREMMMPDSKEAEVVETAMHNIKHGTVGNLMQVLAAEPGEYSYFNQNIMRTWAGPEHWKLKGKSKGAEDEEIKEKNTKKSKKKDFVLDFDAEIDFAAHMKKTRAATTLAKSTIEKYRKSRSKLPDDLHYDGDNMFTLFGKPKVMVKRQREGVEGVDDDIEDYDYDNANDRDNFCPAGDVDDDDDDNDPPGFDCTQATDCTQTQGSFVNDAANESAEGTVLAGDNLVIQPKKVAKIDINYAKTAKKMDIKRLKGSMWSLLTASKSDEDKENVDSTVAGKMSEPMSFQELVKKLPENISKNMARNLSVPIVFVCLLHLANEKTLKISNNEDLSDLIITQDH